MIDVSIYSSFGEILSQTCVLWAKVAFRSPHFGGVVRGRTCLLATSLQVHRNRKVVTSVLKINGTDDLNDHVEHMPYRVLNSDLAAIELAR